MPCYHLRTTRLAQARLNQRELVTPEPGPGVALPCAGPEPPSDLAQEGPELVFAIAFNSY
jgi:hypothetical protein